MKRQYSKWKIILRTFKLIISIVGVGGLLAPMYYLVEGFTPSIMVMLNSRFFDQAALCADGKSELNSLWYIFAWIIGIYIIKEIMMIIGSITINAKIYEKCTAHLKIKLAEKFTKLPLIDYEKSEVYDTCQRARECVLGEKMNALFMISAVIFTHMLGVCATLMVLVTYNVWLLPIAVISVIPNFVSQLISGKAFHMMKQKQAPVIRRTKYFWKLLTTGESQKEIHVNNASDFFLNHWQTLNHTVQKEQYEYQKMSAKNSLICKLLQTVGIGISILLAVAMVLNKQLTIGELGACVIAFTALQNSTSTFFVELGSLDEKILFAEDFFSFIDLAEEEDKAMIEEISTSISLENVTFSYPASTVNAVSDINLKIMEGERIAIVGENGCGKSTLVKLIAGIYKPNAGKVLFGHCSQDIDISNHVSIVWQNFTQFHLSLRENVAISDVAKLEEDEIIIKCLKQINAPSENIETRLGAQFGGVEYSGGQWQRIAIARGLFRERALFILDEPTSALDPMAETEILRMFLDMVKGHTSIIVSHRIGLCQYVDKIVVMKEGKIVEVGKHKELLRCRGEYFRLYEKQSQWYLM